ncbi:hypothetical protein J4204_02880 [Candidatus Woesearchaeota archaeon]|nr:hypothetical protein [Candidatus Woesearchaeota archaeon]
MFFRIKKIKGREYAYIVENSWKRNGSRQKVKGYIGRVYMPNLKHDVNFFKHFNIEDAEPYLQSGDFAKIINDLAEWEILRHGISKDEFLIDLANARIEKNGKKVAFHINDGFMCSLTLRNLLEFRAEGDEENDGYRFARAFVEAGIKVPQEVFIGLFGKLYREL